MKVFAMLRHLCWSKSFKNLRKMKVSAMLEHLGKHLCRSKPLENLSKMKVFAMLKHLAHMLHHMLHLGAISGHLGALLGPSWGHLGAILGPSWGHLGALLGPSWGHLGPSWAILGYLWTGWHTSVKRILQCPTLIRSHFGFKRRKQWLPIQLAVSLSLQERT